jgi:hypothetical protein
MARQFRKSSKRAATNDIVGAWKAHSKSGVQALDGTIVDRLPLHVCSTPLQNLGCDHAH